MTSSMPHNPVSGGAEAALLQLYFENAREQGWHKVFEALGSETLFVTDDAIKASMTNVYGPLRCQCITPDTLLEADVPQDVTRIIFLCRRYEWQLTQAARKAELAPVVISMTYDVAPLGVLENGILPQFDFSGTAGLAKQNLCSHLVVSLPGSDVDYLGLLLAQNDFRPLRPVASSAIKLWVSYCDDFRPIRFLIRALSSVDQAGQFPTLDMTFLYQITRIQDGLLKRLIERLNIQETKVLYFVARDKVRQACLLQVVKGQPFSSLWDRSEKTIASLQLAETDISACYAEVSRLLEVEVEMEEALQSLDRFKYITLEELVDAPVPVLQALGIHFGVNIGRKVRGITWRSRYLALPGFVAQVEEFRQELVTRLDL